MISMFSKTLAGRGRTSVIRAISSVGATSFFLRQQALKCDESPQFVSTSYAKKHHLVSPRTISQLATGSLAGKPGHRGLAKYREPLLIRINVD